MRLLVPFTLGVWALFEAGLLIRDAVRGKGSTANDRGTRSFLVIMAFSAFVTGTGLAFWLRNDRVWQLGPGHLGLGLGLMWLGLAVRVWAVVVLGSAFRTTVEVDATQTVIDSGPYRWIRHPSYTGVLLLAVGYGVTLGNWLSLAILLVIPLVGVLRRITVEECALAEVMGQSYVTYQQHTKRLVPGLY